MDVTIATCQNMPQPDRDEQPLLEALAAAGVEARLAAWNDEAVDWSVAPLTVVRSTWDYFDDRDAFVRWAQRVSAASTVLRNPLSAIIPNTHKSYLAALEREELPVVPTRWFMAGGRPASPDVLRALPWREVIAKPAIGGGSRGVRSFDLEVDEELEAAAAHVRELQQSGEVLVQPRLRSVAEEGERDIVWIDGEVTHVVHKFERMHGDEEQARSVSAPTEEDRLLVARVLRTLPAYDQSELLYARVDAARDELGTLRIIEVELVEPSLFLTMHEPALDRLVRALARGANLRVSQSS
ncbi:MAG: hypothetical protein ABI200_08080 [Gaiellales bacterium]